MASLSLTRLRLRSPRTLPAFLRRSNAAIAQASRAEGFRAGYVAYSWPLAFWTATLWDSEAAMRAFMTTSDHREAMPYFAQWCDEGAVATLPDHVDALPDTKEIGALLLDYGRISPTKAPSPAHRTGDVWPDRRAPLFSNPIQVA